MNRLLLAVAGLMAALVVGVGVLAIVLVAFGGDGGSSGQPGGDGERASGELRLRGSEPLVLDPHILTDVESAVYVVEIFGGLLTLDPDLAIQPDLAAEIPTTENGGKAVNDDGTVTYTFHLRENALFHDNKPVLAEDVKYSLERAVDPATQSLVAEFFLGDIVGAKEKLRGDATEITGVEVVDPRTIAITIERDLPNFLYKLTYPTSYVVDRTQVEDDSNWTRHPNGTGPYKLDTWDFGQRLILKANGHYHLGAPSVETIRYLFGGDPIVLYEGDEIDVAGVPASALTRVREPSDPLFPDYRDGPELEELVLSYLGFNIRKAPFDDPDVRRAFALAIDLPEMVSAILNDGAPIANSIVMPGMPAYNPDARAPQFDPDAAREALAQSSYGGPEGLPEISLATVGTGATAGRPTEAIIEDWREHLGVTVLIERADPASFFEDVDSGTYQMFLLGWAMDYPDEENILNFFFDSESPNNNTGYDNPQVDDLLRSALLEQNLQQRIRLYQQAEQIILDDVVWFPLLFGQAHLLVKPYVQNYLVPPTIVPYLRYITLTE